VIPSPAGFPGTGHFFSAICSSLATCKALANRTRRESDGGNSCRRRRPRFRASPSLPPEAANSSGHSHADVEMLGLVARSCRPYRSKLDSTVSTFQSGNHVQKPWRHRGHGIECFSGDNARGAKPYSWPAAASARRSSPGLRAWPAMNSSNSMACPARRSASSPRPIARYFVAQGQQAGRLQSDNRDAAFHVRFQCPQHAPRFGLRFIPPGPAAKKCSATTQWPATIRRRGKSRSDNRPP